MDIARPDIARQRKRQRRWTVAGVVVLLAILTLAIANVKPIAPRVDRESVWFGTATRGEFIRSVRGHGFLVPERVQYVQSDVDGRIEQIFVQPGAAVTATTVLLQLSNPELAQAVLDAEWQVKAAEAVSIQLEVRLESDRLAQQAAVASLRSDCRLAELDAEVDEKLAAEGLVANLTAQKSRARAHELNSRLELESERLAISGRSIEAQLAVQRADIEKLKAQLALKRRQLDRLNVTAGADGVLQQLGDTETLRIGQRVTPGTTLAKVVEVHRLKAEIRIPETQARDIQLGQSASVDTRNAIVPGRVHRIDPAVQNGAVLVEVTLEGELPKGARPDLSIDGEIEIERLPQALFISRPVHAREHATVPVFKLARDGRSATHVPVQFGRSSVQAIEILAGLQAGDQVILSDMSRWKDHNTVRLQ